jgi:hypothetical protein
LICCFVTVWTIDRALAVFGRRRSEWTVVCVVAGVTMTSGAAFFVSKILPDAWAAPAVISLHLLAWHSDRLRALERAVMTAIVVLAGAFHMATLVLLLALSVLHGVAWVLARKARVGSMGILYAGCAAWAALAALLAADFVVAGRFMVTPGGDIFLFARLTESGLIGKVLTAECPREEPSPFLRALEETVVPPRERAGAISMSRRLSLRSINQPSEKLHHAAPAKIDHDFMLLHAVTSCLQDTRPPRPFKNQKISLLAQQPTRRHNLSKKMALMPVCCELAH